MNRGMLTFLEWTKDICVRNVCVNRRGERERYTERVRETINKRNSEFRKK